ncbi:hypothetical protein [Spirosoma arcticum]
MSAKSARRNRQALSQHTFPERIEEHGHRSASYQVQVDHTRRIRGLSKSQAITVQDAIQRYGRKLGLVQKPKGQ